MSADQNIENTMNNVEMQPEWEKGESVRSGSQPSGFKLRSLEFGAKGSGKTPALQKLGLEELVGASAFESANLKPNHVEPGALTGMLAETMSKLEDKYNNGEYDAAAMPLVEQYIEEMHKMAKIQLDRAELISKKTFDIREANQAAFNAVYERRVKREEEIRGSYEKLASERKDKKDAKKRYKEDKKDAKRKAKAQRDEAGRLKKERKEEERKTREKFRITARENEIRKDSMKIELEESLNKQKIAENELRSAEVEVKTQELKASIERKKNANVQAQSDNAEIDAEQQKTEDLHDTALENTEVAAKNLEDTNKETAQLESEVVIEEEPEKEESKAEESVSDTKNAEEPEEDGTIIASVEDDDAQDAEAEKEF